jgi:hypothetical protein
MEAERRKLLRRNFSYYMRVMDEATGKLIGHLSDIGTGGFKVDSNQLLPLNVDFRLRIDQIGEISNKMCLIFKARTMWCRNDLFDPNMYNVGFKIVDMTTGDHDIFMKMFNIYGVQDSSQKDDSDYAWK